MQPTSHADTTISDLRARMGEDVDLLSYLPDEKAQKEAFQNKKATRSSPLPLRILFGKVEKRKSSPREVWALLYSKPGSSRAPECQLRYFSSEGELEETIALEEAMEKVTLTAAFTCLKAQNGRFDRAHLSSVLGYYFILQMKELPSPWPISDLFVSDLKAACRMAQINAENDGPVSKSRQTDEVTPLKIGDIVELKNLQCSDETGTEVI